MDELLPRSRSIFIPLPARSREAVRTHSKPAIRPFKVGWSIPDFLERRNSAHPAIFMTATLSLAAAAVLGTLFLPCQEVTVDGVSLGLVTSLQAVEQAIDRVEARASRILGYEYTLAHEVDYTFHMALKGDQIPVSQVETYLFDQIGEVMMTSVLTVNGQNLGAFDDAAGLDAMLDSLMDPYITDNTILAEFVEPVSVARAYTPTADLREIDDVRELLTSNSMEQVDYSVQPGETFLGIARELDISSQELQSLNPGIDIDTLMIGQVLTVSQAVPYLSVRTVDNLTYEGPVDFPIEYVDDATMYQGNSKILTQGVEGWAIYNADVTYLNGTERERDILSTEILTQPVTQVVAVGTKERPKTMATGTFQWPIRGTITSGYGNRYIFGSYSFHSGIDIAAPYGSAIAAADGGKVIWSGKGTGGNWSYGNYVVIDHENGYHTYYAHCSSLLVKAGDRVYKGQTIAKVGSTGNSTGNHCHFQVKKNGVTVSPWNYLP